MSVPKAHPAWHGHGREHEKRAKQAWQKVDGNHGTRDRGAWRVHVVCGCFEREGRRLGRSFSRSPGPLHRMAGAPSRRTGWGQKPGSTPPAAWKTPKAGKPKKIFPPKPREPPKQSRTL